MSKPVWHTGACKHDRKERAPSTLALGICQHAHGSRHLVRYFLEKLRVQPKVHENVLLDSSERWRVVNDKDPDVACTCVPSQFIIQGPFLAWVPQVSNPVPLTSFIRPLTLFCSAHTLRVTLRAHKPPNGHTNTLDATRRRVLPAALTPPACDRLRNHPAKEGSSKQPWWSIRS
jgi:hypothetical protein